MTPSHPHAVGVDGAWPPATFEIATTQGIVKKNGYAMLGLGLYLVTAASPTGRRKAKWSLTHLGTGHLIAYITGTVAAAFPIATEIAEAGDWTFDSLGGAANQFPDAGAKVGAIMARHSKDVSRGGKGMTHEGQARAIAAARS